MFLLWWLRFASSTQEVSVWVNCVKVLGKKFRFMRINSLKLHRQFLNFVLVRISWLITRHGIILFLYYYNTKFPLDNGLPES